MILLWHQRVLMIPQQQHSRIVECRPSPDNRSDSLEYIHNRDASTHKFLASVNARSACPLQVWKAVERGGTISPSGWYQLLSFEPLSWGPCYQCASGSWFEHGHHMVTVRESDFLPRVHGSTAVSPNMQMSSVCFCEPGEASQRPFPGRLLVLDYIYYSFFWLEMLRPTPDLRQGGRGISNYNGSRRHNGSRQLLQMDRRSLWTHSNLSPRRSSSSSQ